MRGLSVGFSAKVGCRCKNTRLPRCFQTVRRISFWQSGQQQASGGAFASHEGSGSWVCRQSCCLEKAFRKAVGWSVGWPDTSLRKRRALACHFKTHPGVFLQHRGYGLSPERFFEDSSPLLHALARMYTHGRCRRRRHRLVLSVGSTADPRRPITGLALHDDCTVRVGCPARGKGRGWC